MFEKVFAQTQLGTIGGDGLGPFGNRGYTGQTSGPFADFAGGVSTIIGVMTIIGAIWFMIQFLIASFYWITSGGEKGKLEQARDRIVNAFVGLIILVAGWSLLALIGQVLGLNTVFNVTELMNTLRPLGN